MPAGRPLTSRATSDVKFVRRIETLAAELVPCLIEPPGIEAASLNAEYAWGVRSRPLKRSRSTRPEIPGTLPSLVYCQNVQPWPPQLLAGIVGALTFQWAIQSVL